MGKLTFRSYYFLSPLEDIDGKIIEGAQVESGEWIDEKGKKVDGAPGCRIKLSDDMQQKADEAIALLKKIAMHLDTPESMVHDWHQRETVKKHEYCVFWFGFTVFQSLFAAIYLALYAQESFIWIFPLMPGFAGAYGLGLLLQKEP